MLLVAVNVEGAVHPVVGHHGLPVGALPHAALVPGVFLWVDGGDMVVQVLSGALLGGGTGLGGGEAGRQAGPHGRRCVT